MFVGERMSHPVVYVAPDMPAQDVLQLMNKEKIRRTPVVKEGKLVGIVSREDLLNASPSQATSLSIWELNYLLSKVTVAEVMTEKVITVTEDTTLEGAARLMLDHKIGGLPVMRNGGIVGIITESDLFSILLELLGGREFGVRVTVMVEDKPGELAKLVNAIGEAGGNIIATGQFAGDDQTAREVMLKVRGLEEAVVKKLAEKFAKELKDIRTSKP